MSDQDGYPQVVHCPLCNGPLHLEDSELVCVAGHEVSHEDAARHTELRLLEALHMSIEALNSEAMMLRLQPHGARLADAADAQSDLLRKFARRHADGE